jgi:hypothetical protein
MVTYTRDTTGRFPQRPHYKPAELDRECETIINGFLKDLHRKIEFPVSTDDLTKLIERDASDLDIYADLSDLGDDVEGVTEFYRGKKPAVKIAARLSEDARYENRLRTTMTHEFGHVRFHAYLWEMNPPTPDLLRSKPEANKQICKRETIVGAKETDWMEWQAGYICGALLVPATPARRLLQGYMEERNLFGALSVSSIEGAGAIRLIVDGFQVSQDAARVRLLQLGVLGAGAPTKSLFA